MQVLRARTSAERVAGPWTGMLVLLGLILPAEMLAADKEPAPLEMQKPAYENPWQRYSGWPGENWDKFNTLANLASPPPAGLQKVEGEINGDPEKGKELAFDRKRGGSCLACHVMPGATLPGSIGPDLSTVATWGRTDEHLYNYIYDPRTYKPDSMMPPWGAHGVFSPEEIRDIVAYLKTLNKPAVFKSEEDNPAHRPIPSDERDNLDFTENPGMFEVDTGEAVYNRVGPAGQSCASCHSEPAQTFKTWAATMPKYEPRMKKVLGVEEFLTRHARATTGEDLLMETKDNLALSIYLRHLANGTPIQVDVESDGAREAARRGQELTRRKIGQLNFACIDCHTEERGALKWIRGQYLTTHKGQVAHFPTYRTSRGEIWDLRKRFQWCGVAIRANELPPDAPEYDDIELYLTSLNNGVKLSVPGLGP